MERKSRWERFKSFAILFSFTVNVVTILSLLVGSVPAAQTAFTLKADTVEPLLNDLDAAFVKLGESEIVTVVEIDEELDIRFDLPLDQPLPIDFPLPIQQDTAVMLTQRVPLYNLPATFVLPGGGGQINGTVSLALPAGMFLPIRLDMSVPVTSTIPVRLNVPVDQTVPVRMTVPVRIKLGESGLQPAVDDLRRAIQPISTTVQSLPDGIGIGGE
ncbi:MAG: hypothetical protein JXA14_12365 [Anaerolineae bacterium]|nr:hypothetical protein [Anaerolineae bacterium]